MRYTRLLFCVALGLSSISNAMESRTEIIEQFDDLKLVAFIPTADITNSPEWKPEVGEPPLSVGEAINAVRKLDAGTDHPIREIELRPITNSPTHWHYLVKTSNAKKTTRFDIYVILMNGRVIPAMIEPKSVR